MSQKYRNELTLIEANGSDKNYWIDLWRFRELFYVLAKRDVVVRYKQTIIGFSWALIRPFITMVIFTVVFGRLANLPVDGETPYALMVFAALLPWQLFSSAFSDATNCLVGNANLITKVYFPRIIFPVSGIVVAFVDFLISMLILFLLMIWYFYTPSWNLIFLPFFILMALLAALGPGMWIAALNVKYRDIRYVIPFVIQIGLYVSPVGFSSSIIPDKWRLLYSINPMVGVIDGFRWSILGDASVIYLPGFILSWFVIIGFLLFGFIQFRKTEKIFADVI